MALVLIAAAFAGVITTLAGFGGGLLLALSLAAVMDPAAGLGIAAAALVFGNGHRLFVLRRELDVPSARLLALGIFPAALLCAVFSAWLPTVALRLLLVATASLALLAKLASFQLALPPRRLVLAGAGIGAFGVTGGAGLFAGPVLLAGGLRGDRYVATMSAIGVLLNVARSIGYGAAGWLDATTLWAAPAAAVALMAGNVVGRRLSRRIDERVRAAIVVAVPMVALVLSAIGLVADP